MAAHRKPVAAIALIVRNGLVLAATRRGTKDDYALIGGGLEPGESAREALKREVAEETGLEVVAAEFVFERVDRDGHVAWCFRVTEFSGEPETKEEGIEISWRFAEDLLTERCTFREYNEALFRQLGMIS